jgi:hypothetical protein
MPMQALALDIALNDKSWSAALEQIDDLSR